MQLITTAKLGVFALQGSGRAQGDRRVLPKGDLQSSEEEMYPEHSTLDLYKIQNDHWKSQEWSCKEK